MLYVEKSVVRIYHLYVSEQFCQDIAERNCSHLDHREAAGYI